MFEISMQTKFDILTSGNAVVVAVKTARNVIEEEEEVEAEDGAEGSEAPAAEAPAAEAPATE